MGLVSKLWPGRKTDAPASGPDGQRIYIIGDVHGRADLLDILLDRIVSDDGARSGIESSIVFLGDLIDRGPDSAEVVRRVRELVELGVARLIKGNHEETLVRAATGDPVAVRGLIHIGGLPTLHSYGLTEEEINTGTFEELGQCLAERIPADDIAFLDRGEDVILLGDYILVHAGIRPGIAIERQSEQDLRWIREPFLKSTRDHGGIIVHGHTVMPEVVERPNRIGIDTGAYETGVLTALVIEGPERWYIDTRHRVFPADRAAA